MGRKLLALPFILMTTLGYAGEASQALNQGATIWSEGDSEDPQNSVENIGGGSGPFQVIVTPTNF